MGCRASSAQAPAGADQATKTLPQPKPSGKPAAAPSPSKKPDAAPAPALVGKIVEVPHPKPKPQAKPKAQARLSSKLAAPLGPPDTCLPCSFARCARVQCPCAASWNGQQGQYCCKACKDGTPCEVNCHTTPRELSTDSMPLPARKASQKAPSKWFAACARPECKCSASFNGEEGQFCCFTCKLGNPCSENKHVVPSKPDAALFAPCASHPRCPCTASWNGQRGKHCCKNCAAGTPCTVPTHMVPTTAGPPKFSRCAREGCPCTASFSGKAGDYCCKSCRKGTRCEWNAHSVPQAEVANLCLCGCGKPSYNNKAGEFAGKTCRQKYASNTPAKPLNDFHSIRAHADFWARSAWPTSCGYTIHKFYKNPGLDDVKCPARSKFLSGLTAKGLAGSTTTSAEFAWHGTKTIDAVRGICWNGLSPGLRRGQAYGPGEYFSVAATDSQGYASSTGYLIVCLLLQGKHKSSHGNYRVVDNPANGDPMYCLPVGVVDYNANADPELQKTVVALHCGPTGL